MNSNKSEHPVKTLIILLNMGGPQNKEEIHPYLKELFQDRELLKLPFQKSLDVSLLGGERLRFKSAMKKSVNTHQPRPSWKANVWASPKNLIT